MRVNNRFYIFALTEIILFIAWLIFFDSLLLSLWVSLILVITFSLVINRISLIGIHVNRFSRKKILEIGETFEERLEIRNNSNTPKFWIELNDRSKLLSKVSSRVITNLGINNIGTFTSTVKLNKRGYFLLGPIELVSGDPFGLFTTSKIFHFKNSLLVNPKIISLSQFPLLPANLLGGESMHLPTADPTPQAAGVREYLPGDPLAGFIGHPRLSVTN